MPITFPSSRKRMLEYRSCGWVSFVPKFSDRSARFVNRYRLGLPTSIFSRVSCQPLVGDHLVLVVKHTSSICSLIRRLTSRPGHDWSCRNISPKPSPCFFCFKTTRFRRLVHNHNFCDFIVCLWISQFLFRRLKLFNHRSFDPCQ